MKNPITVITGTSRGIGRYLAEYYIKKNHFVIGCSRSEIDFVEKNYFHFKVDVSDEAEVKKIFSFTRKEFGYIDHLINNAGIASMNHFLLTPLSTVNKVLDTNFIGTFLFCREAAKLMLPRMRGRIINFTTVATPLQLEGEAIYAASKAAVESLTKITARELAQFNITVNSVGPTPVDTDLIRSVPKEKMDKLIARQAITRKGLPEDIANVIDFYIHEKSNFITGQNIFLGGIS